MCAYEGADRDMILVHKGIMEHDCEKVTIGLGAAASGCKVTAMVKLYDGDSETMYVPIMIGVGEPTAGIVTMLKTLGVSEETFNNIIYVTKNSIHLKFGVPGTGKCAYTLHDVVVKSHLKDWEDVSDIEYVLNWQKEANDRVRIQRLGKIVFDKDGSMVIPVRTTIGGREMFVQPGGVIIYTMTKRGIAEQGFDNFLLVKSGTPGGGNLEFV